MDENEEAFDDYSIAGRASLPPKCGPTASDGFRSDSGLCAISIPHCLLWWVPYYDRVGSKCGKILVIRAPGSSLR